MFLIHDCVSNYRDRYVVGWGAVYGVEWTWWHGDSCVVEEWRALSLVCVWITTSLFPRRPTRVRSQHHTPFLPDQLNLPPSPSLTFFPLPIPPSPSPWPSLLSTPSPLNPHCTILETMVRYNMSHDITWLMTFDPQCWSSDGYHLWMLTSSRDKQKKELLGDTAEGSGQVLVMQFMRNAIVSNPILVSERLLILHPI